MARNVVQFQKGLSEPAFEQQYATEEQCRAIVIQLRWPDGFECTHQAIKTGSGSASARTPAFKWVNTALGNIKASIVGTYRSINSKHVPRYLAEFEYRFNRRYDLSAMMPRLCWASVRTTPMPYRLLKLAEVYA